MQVAGEDGAGNERLGVALQVALERARAVDRVIPVGDDERLGGVGHLEVQRAVSQAAAKGGDEVVNDVRQVVARERTEHEDLIQTVEKLRPESAAQLALHVLARVRGDLAVRADAVEQVLAAEVRREDDDRVLEVHRAALAVRDAAVVEDLQQDVEHIRVRLFDLIEQHDGVRLAAHGLGELAALVVADVSGRRADETRDGEFLHVLGHVDAHHAALIVKQALGQCLGQFRLADTRRAKEQERADRAVRVADAGTRALDGLADLLHGLVLADQAAVQHFVEVQQLLALALHELCHRDAGPLGDDAGDLLLGHGVVHEGVVALAALGRGFGLGELLFEARQVGVLQARGLFVLIVALGLFDLGVQVVNVRLEGLDLLDAVLLGLPAGLLLVEAVLELGELLRELFEPVARELVVLFLEGHLLDLHLHDAAAQVVELRRHGVDLRADHGAGLVDEVDGLVRQETIGDIAVGERGRGDERVVVDAHAVVDLVALFQAAEDGNGVLHRRLIDLHGLEAALERGVLFDILAVLVERRRADAVQLAAGEHRLEQVAGVHAALGLARADDGVQLIDEQQDAALALAHFLEHGLEPLLEFAAVLCARDQRAHIERENGLVLQPLRHVAAHDALRQPFGDGRLADARLADEHGVVLCFAREDADDVADLLIAADDRVHLAFAGALDEVGAVLFQCVIGVLGVVARDGAGLDLFQLGHKARLRDAVRAEDALDGGGLVGEDAEHQVLDGDVGVAAGLGLALGEIEDLARFRRGVHLAAAAGDLRQLVNSGVQLAEHGVAVHAHAAEQRADQAAVGVNERIEQVLRREILVAVFLRHALGGLDGFDCLLREFISVHSRVAACSGTQRLLSWMVANGSDEDRRALLLRAVERLDLGRGVLPGEVCLHEPVEQLHVVRDRAGNLLARVVVIRRERERAHELAVVQCVIRLYAGQVRVLDLLPEAEKLRHALQQLRRLGAEDDGQLAEPLLLVAVERDLVLDRRAVLVLQAALERHARRVRREKRHQVARRRDELLDLVENVLDAALRRHDRGIVGKDLIDECRAVRAHAVSHAVDLAHDLLVEHEAV